MVPRDLRETISIDLGTSHLFTRKINFARTSISIGFRYLSRGSLGAKIVQLHFLHHTIEHVSN